MDKCISVGLYISILWMYNYSYEFNYLKKLLLVDKKEYVFLCDVLLVW